MAKRKVSREEPQEKKSFWATLPGILTAITALITAVGGLLAAINSTAELFPAKETPTPVSPAYTDTPIPLPTETFTPVPTPEFISQFTYYSEANPNPDVEQVELDVKPGILPEDTIQDFIRLSSIDFGELGADGVAFNIRLILRNTSDAPLVLDLTDRFFSLEDDQGQEAELIYFCCNSRAGEILGAGQERTIQLLFKAPSGWFGKNIAANYIFIRVDGLLPINRLAWRMHTLKAAE